jgi:hypothetical protein
MDDARLNQILDEFERESFLNPTLIASGHGTVAAVIAGMPEIKSLLEEGDAARRLTAARYRERDANMSNHERLVYFVLFGLLKHREMSREIAAWLRRSAQTPHSQLAWPWNPFLHGVRTLESFTGGAVHAPAGSFSPKEVERFLADVEKWERTHE